MAFVNAPACGDVYCCYSGIYTRKIPATNGKIHEGMIRILGWSFWSHKATQDSKKHKDHQEARHYFRSMKNEHLIWPTAYYFWGLEKEGLKAKQQVGISWQRARNIFVNTSKGYDHWKNISYKHQTGPDFNVPINRGFPNAINKGSW